MLLAFVKFHAKQVNFVARSKSLVIVLNFRILQGSVETQLMWNGSLNYRYKDNFIERIMKIGLAEVMT